MVRVLSMDGKPSSLRARVFLRKVRRAPRAVTFPAQWGTRSIKEMYLTTGDKECVQKCVEKASSEATERFEQLREDANDAAKYAGTEVAREAEIGGLGPDEVEDAYDEAAAKAWQEVWIRDAFGDDPPPGLIFCQPSESAYIEAAAEEAEEQALRELETYPLMETEACGS